MGRSPHLEPRGGPCPWRGGSGRGSRHGGRDGCTGQERYRCRRLKPFPSVAWGSMMRPRTAARRIGNSVMPRWRWATSGRDRRRRASTHRHHRIGLQLPDFEFGGSDVEPIPIEDSRLPPPLRLLQNARVAIRLRDSAGLHSVRIKAASAPAGMSVDARSSSSDQDAAAVAAGVSPSGSAPPSAPRSADMAAAA